MPRKKTVPEQKVEQAVSAETDVMNAAPFSDTTASPPVEETADNASEYATAIANDPGGNASDSDRQEVTEPKEPDTPCAEESLPVGSPPDAPDQEDSPDNGSVPDLSGQKEAVEEAADQEYGALLQDWAESDPASEEGSEAPLTLDTATDDGAVPDAPAAKDVFAETKDSPDPATAPLPRRRASTRPATESRNLERERVLTITAGDELQTEEDRKAAAWHEIQNADWTHRILTGTIDNVEKNAAGNTVAVVIYKGFRVLIPLKEMLLYPEPYPTGPEYAELMERMRRILMTRLHTEIDFVIKGHDNKEHFAVGSRKDAMYRKRQTFYLDKNERGEPLIYEGRIVQARVMSVAEKMIRVEVFGVECPIVARGISRAWIGDATEKYSIKKPILVRVLKITGDTVQNLAVTVDVRSVHKDDEESITDKCVVQGRYAGRVTDVRNGMVFIRLNNGANAIAHSCYDRRTPGKRDDVSFAVTRLDPEQNVAIGAITRIICQNL